MTTTDMPPMRLRVTRNERIADGIHLFELQDAAGGALPAFTAGAHIAIRTPNGLLRKYSLCNDPAERNRYQVAIKREANGRGGSIDLIDRVNGGGKTLPAVLLLARTGDHRVLRRTERAGIKGQRHHPLRLRRPVALARSQDDPGGTEKPRASVLLRTAAVDGSRAPFHQPLVAGRCALRSLQRSRDAQGERHIVQGEAGALGSNDRGGGGQDHSRSPAGARPRCAEFMRDRHLRHLQDEIAGRRGRSTASASRVRLGAGYRAPATASA